MSSGSHTVGAAATLSVAAASSTDQDPGPVVFSADDIARAIDRVADAIRRDYAYAPVLMVAVLKGAVPFAGDLMRALADYPLSIDYMAVASYGTGRDGKSAGRVRLLKDLDTDPAGRHVLLVEDIVDEGITLEFLLANIASRGAKSVKSCVLVDKPYRRATHAAVDYVGLRGPDAFLVGYGLDHQERFRNLPHICKLTGPP